MTMMELMESDKVCHASAISATEPVTIPAQNLSPKRDVLTMIDQVPSLYAAMALSLFLSNSVIGGVLLALIPFLVSGRKITHSPCHTVSCSYFSIRF